MGFIIPNTNVFLIIGMVLLLLNVIFTISIVKTVGDFYKKLILLLLVWLVPFLGIGFYLLLKKTSIQKAKL